jgi:indole-3-glycerol phosphate synthase
MDSFLDKILGARAAAVVAAKVSRPQPEVEAAARDAPPVRGFRDALALEGTSVIAEIKRASPSRGDLRAELDPSALAKAYADGGARALSVLTEPDFFKGSAADLEAARDATELPVLWKDFVLEPYQVFGARSHGADAVLLIVRILDEERLRELLDAAASVGMCALVEVFDEIDLERALLAGSDVIGVNHRDLETFEEDTSATARLSPLIPDDVLLVGESAISTRADVEALEAIGVDAVLVGEVLVRSDDPAATLRGLLG